MSNRSICVTESPSLTIRDVIPRSGGATLSSEIDCLRLVVAGTEDLI